MLKGIWLFKQCPLGNQPNKRVTFAGLLRMSIMKTSPLCTDAPHVSFIFHGRFLHLIVQCCFNLWSILCVMMNTQVQWCGRWGCKRTPKSFYLPKIPENPEKIFENWAKSQKIWTNSWKSGRKNRANLLRNLPEAYTNACQGSEEKELILCEVFSVDFGVNSTKRRV